MIWLVALAQSATVSDLGPGWVDWSRPVLVVEAAAEATPAARRDRSAVELEARRLLGAALAEAAGRVPVEGDTRAIDLLAGEHGRALEENLVRWRVTEARYGRSGAVSLTGELDLARWLRPLAASRASGSDDAPERAVTATGVVVDARRADASPSYAPRLLDPQGGVLYELDAMSPLAAARGAPVRWVSDPADPLVVEIAGLAPILVLATASRHADLVVEANDAARLRALAAQSDLLARGRVVVVAE